MLCLGVFMRVIGVVASNARTYEVPMLVFKDAEAYVREEVLVVIEDIKFGRKYLGILRLTIKLDPLLTTSQRSAVIEKPEIADEGLDIPYETSVIRIIGEIFNGRVEPPTTPPTPRSKVYIVESPNDLKLDLGSGLIVGIHKYSGVEVPLRPEALKYHIAIVGTTGTGKSRLVKVLVDEVLSKTDWNVLIFDHTGMDYVPYWPNNVVRGDEIVLDVNTITEGLKLCVGSIENLIEDYVPVALIRYIACKNNPKLCTQLNNQQVEKLYNLSREDIEELTIKISSSNLWSVEELAKVVNETASELSARRPTPLKLSLYISLFARHYVSRLNRMSVSVDEVINKLISDRITVIDLSTVETEVRRVIVKRCLERLWEIITKLFRPINTLIVIDEAHNYACQYGCSPSNTLIEKTLREGRKWNLGVILASQRVIDFAPDVRNNVNTVFFSKLQTPYDFEQLRNFVDLAGIRPEVLSLLETREFYFAGLGNPLKYPMLIKVREVGEPPRTT